MLFDDLTSHCCQATAGSAGLHNASTYSIDTNVRRIAVELEDTALLAKLAAGDMIAIEAKYHHDCLRRLYNRGRKVVHKSNNEDDLCLHGKAFAELVAFPEGTNSDDDSAPVFKLTDIAQMYKTRVEQLGGIVATRIHTTKLKNRLLSVLPDLRAYSKGRDTLLSFEKTVGQALITACTHDDEAMRLMQQRMLYEKIFLTQISYLMGRLRKTVTNKKYHHPLALVNMALDGVNIKDQSQIAHSTTSKAALTISQLLVFNSVKHVWTSDPSKSVCHNRSQETPLPIYVSMKIHAVT